MCIRDSSTASEFAQADSNPKNAHNVIEIDTPIASKVGTLCGFQEFTYIVPVSYTHLDVYKRQRENHIAIMLAKIPNTISNTIETKK